MEQKQKLPKIATKDAATWMKVKLRTLCIYCCYYFIYVADAIDIGLHQSVALTYVYVASLLFGLFFTFIYVWVIKHVAP